MSVVVAAGQPMVCDNPLQSHLPVRQLLAGFWPDFCLQPLACALVSAVPTVMQPNPSRMHVMVAPVANEPYGCVGPSSAPSLTPLMVRRTLQC